MSVAPQTNRSAGEQSEPGVSQCPRSCCHRQVLSMGLAALQWGGFSDRCACFERSLDPKILWMLLDMSLHTPIARFLLALAHKNEAEREQVNHGQQMEKCCVVTGHPAAELAP